jgi:hypothetical protein
LIDSLLAVVVEPVKLWAAVGRKALPLRCRPAVHKSTG